MFSWYIFQRALDIFPSTIKNFVDSGLARVSGFPVVVIGNGTESVCCDVFLF